MTSDGSETFYKLNINPMNYRHKRGMYEELKEKDLLRAYVNFGKSPDKLKAEYLDVYEGVYAKVISTDRFDEDMDLSTIYLGQINMTRSTRSITACGYTKGQLLDGTECNILVDTGVSKVIHVKIIFYEMQKPTLFTQIYLYNYKNSSG